MKQLLYLLFAITLFASCSDDDKQQEVFITDETLARETLKNSWIVQDMVYKSNFSEFDKSLNASSKSMIKNNVLTLSFAYNKAYGYDMVTSEAQPKSGGLGIGEIDPYRVEKDIIYVTEKDKSVSAYTFKISESTLIMALNLTKSDLLLMLKRENTEQEVIDAFDKLVPSNYTGTYTMYLKRK